MAFFPISHAAVQYVDTNGDAFSGAVLKAYSSGTLTNINMATDSTGATTAATITLDSDGYPAVSGTIIIPYIDEKYKLGLYPTQAAADSDTGSIWLIDAVPISGDLLSVTQSISTTTSLDSSDDGNHVVATGTITITLPAVTVVGTGFVVSIRNAGTGLVTIDGNGAETINGSTTLVLFPGDSCIFTSSSTETDEWSTIGLKELRGVNAQTGTTYTFVSGDHDKLVTTTNAAAIAGTLPQAGAAFPDGWYTTVSNIGVGALTITPTTSTIDGAATLILIGGASALITSDGTNYFSSLQSQDAPLEIQIASASATIDFTSNIDSTFTRYKITWDKLVAATDNVQLLVRTGTGSFESGASDYDTSNFLVLSTGTTSAANGGVASSMLLGSATIGNGADESCSGTLILHDPSETARRGHITFENAHNNGASKARWIGSAYRDTGAAISRLQFRLSSGNITSGTFKLYGVP